MLTEGARPTRELRVFEDEILASAFGKITKFLTYLYPDGIPDFLQQRLAWVTQEGRVVTDSQRKKRLLLENGWTDRDTQIVAGFYSPEEDRIYVEQGQEALAVHELLHALSARWKDGKLQATGFDYRENRFQRYLNESMTTLLETVIIHERTPQLKSWVSLLTKRRWNGMLTHAVEELLNRHGLLYQAGLKILSTHVFDENAFAVRPELADAARFYFSNDLTGFMDYLSYFYTPPYVALYSKSRNMRDFVQEQFENIMQVEMRDFSKQIQAVSSVPKDWEAQEESVELIEPLVAGFAGKSTLSRARFIMDFPEDVRQLLRFYSHEESGRMHVIASWELLGVFRAAASLPDDSLLRHVLRAQVATIGYLLLRNEGKVPDEYGEHKGVKEMIERSRAYSLEDQKRGEQLLDVLLNSNDVSLLYEQIEQEQKQRLEEQEEGS